MYGIHHEDIAALPAVGELSDPRSPDLAQCGFFMFPMVKFALKETTFETDEAVKVNNYCNN